MQFYNKRQLLKLKAKIKGLANEGRRTRRILQTKSGDVRHHLWNIKRETGLETRLHLIAYGLLRGKRFSEIESNTKLPDELPKDPASVEYQLYSNWHYDFPWDKLLDLIIANCPSHSPHYGVVEINGKSIYSEHKYWTKDNLKNLILKDRPLPNDQIYDAKILEKYGKAS